MLHATLTLSTGGALHDASVREVMLNCSSPEDAGTRARLVGTDGMRARMEG